ncbi:MAG: hypothetical protein JWP94_1295 [Mucilaginibacter sp.]|nr:hypothetical protein [Mucilaginibacter sp.]
MRDNVRGELGQYADVQILNVQISDTEIRITDFFWLR